MTGFLTHPKDSEEIIIRRLLRTMERQLGKIERATVAPPPAVSSSRIQNISNSPPPIPKKEVNTSKKILPPLPSIPQQLDSLSIPHSASETDSALDPKLFEKIDTTDDGSKNKISGLLIGLLAVLLTLIVLYCAEMYWPDAMTY